MITTLISTIFTITFICLIGLVGVLGMGFGLVKVIAWAIKEIKGAIKGDAGKGA